MYTHILIYSIYVYCVCILFIENEERMDGKYTCHAITIWLQVNRHQFARHLRSRRKQHRNHNNSIKNNNQRLWRMNNRGDVWAVYRCGMRSCDRFTNIYSQHTSGDNSNEMIYTNSRDRLNVGLHIHCKCKHMIACNLDNTAAWPRALAQSFDYDDYTHIHTDRHRLYGQPAQAQTHKLCPAAYRPLEKSRRRRRWSSSSFEWIYMLSRSFSSAGSNTVWRYACRLILY